MLRLLVIAAAVATPALAEHPILPGYWESTSRATFIIDQPPKTDRRCLTEQTVDQYISTPSTSHYKCSYTHKSVSGGKADFEGQCHDKHGRTFPVSIHGTYEPERFRMKLSVLNLPIGAVTEAKRISATCPAGK